MLHNAHPLASEEVPLDAAAGRYLAEPVVATLDLPPFTNSAMDGFALRHHDAPGRFELIGESAAGAPFAGSVGPGQAVTISTGAVLPDGADAVAPIEWITLDGEGAIEVPRAVPQHYSVRHAGSDVHHGTQVLPAGIRIGAAQIGAAAALGVGSLHCGCRPRVAVLTTGSELRPVGERLGPGEIYDSNGPLLQAALASAGAELTLVPTAADTREAHRDAIEQALSPVVVISSCGVSVGGHDVVREVDRELGVRELFWRIAMRPGKPLSVGRASREPQRGQVLTFGVPGNPVSVPVCFELFVRPALAALQGARDARPAFTRATLASSVQRNPERDDFIRVRHVGDGRIEPLTGQQSHQLAITALAEGLARIPAGSGAIARGQQVDYLPLGVS